MKKTVKSLIIAASVAAIAGIGAVSFAAWQAGNPTDATYGPGTGKIEVTAGDLSATGTNLKLVPYDQVAQLDETTMTTMETITLKYTGGENKATADAYTYKMALTNDDTLPIYYQIKGEDEVDVPTTDPTAEGSGWTLFNTDVAITLDDNGEATVYLILVSTDTENHMDKGYTVTFSAAKK